MLRICLHANFVLTVPFFPLIFLLGKCIFYKLVYCYCFRSLSCVRYQFCCCVARMITAQLIHLPPGRSYNQNIRLTTSCPTAH
uniref:Putative secreted peptide n=1 Tax=Anopheles braziliensis TaxID=58242 RepID=A0A2M3ZWU0_9DIPT